jgi:hypothetical protein
MRHFLTTVINKFLCGKFFFQSISCLVIGKLQRADLHCEPGIKASQCNPNRKSLTSRTPKFNASFQNDHTCRSEVV